MDHLVEIDKVKPSINLRKLPDEAILDCDSYFLYLLQDIKKATKTIDLETYIYSDDVFGLSIADALIDAARRGVRVRALVDGSGTSVRSKALELMESNGVHVRIFHPYPWKLWHLRHANIETSFLFKIFYMISNLNARNHRKTFMIDQKIIYLGSVNISQRHLSWKYRGENWQDTVIRLNHVETKDLEIAYNIAWNGFPLEERVKELLLKKRIVSRFRLNFSWRRRRAAYKALLRKITRCHRRVWITSAYFNPNYILLRKLMVAAKRGIDVKIILPFKSDVIMMPMIAATFYHDLLIAGVKIYEYEPNILHSKIIIIDDWFCVGSSNLNQRSLHHDLEVDVELQTRQAKQTIEEQFIMNLQQSHLMTLSAIQKLSVSKRVFARLLLFLKYFL